MENNMTLGKWLANNIINEANSNITTVVAIYPGRFQPMGKHHAQAYKWLKSKFKDAYVATSDKVQLPKSPFSFNEKKKIISSYGIKNIVKVKNPYKAEEVLKKYDPETTAAVVVTGFPIVHTSGKISLTSGRISI
jgi:phosphopantetheine adenylyltransferase